MVFENFLTYTEVDQGNDITVTAPKIDVDTIQRSALSYVYKSFGANHFGDFKHLYEVTAASVSANDAYTGVWGLANAAKALAGMNTDNIGFSLHLYSPFAVPRLYIRDYSTDNADFYDFLAWDTTYYLTLKRAATTLTCEIYSDSARTLPNLLDTLSIVCATTTFSHLMAMLSSDYAGTQTTTYYMENLDLQEAVPKIPRHSGQAGIAHII